MNHRVLIGKKLDATYGIEVSRPGFDVGADPRPLLETNQESQQVLLAGFVDHSIIPDTFGATVYVPFGITFSFTPILLFWPIFTNTGPDPVADWFRYATPNDYENPGNSGTLFGTYSLLVDPSGFQVTTAHRNYIGGNVVNPVGWALQYQVTKTRLL